MKNNKIYIVLALLTVVLTSCGKFLDEYSQDMIVPSKVSDLDEVLLGDVYIKAAGVTYGMSNASCAFINMLDDDINTTGAQLSDRGNSSAWPYLVKPTFGYFAWQQDVRYNYGKTNSQDDKSTWADLYRRINVCNIILSEIEDLAHVTDEDNATYLRVKGETCFLRAQFFLMLANLYGDAYAPSTCSTKLCVPLKLTPYVEYDKEKKTQFVRATVEQVYNQIVTDLKSATDYLKQSPQAETHRLHRASWEAASLLLSRVYLYMQNWSEAENAANAVMNSTNASLAGLATLGDGVNFLTESNPEILFTQGINHLAPITDDISVYAIGGDHCVTHDLYNMYADNDKRKSCFFAVASNDSVRLTTKYERGLKMNPIGDVFTLRLSEAYLNYAEACAMQQGKESQACTALNTLRSNRIDGYTNETYSGAELARQIRDERRKELCFEGQRWFDLRRYAVNTLYPYSRDIIHVFNVYNDNTIYVTTLLYKLPAGDPSYTFSIPKAILEADVEPMPDNIRNERLPLDIKNN